MLANQEGRALIAQLTDIHLCGPGRLYDGWLDTEGMFRAAIEQVNALDPQPDLVLLTGDLVDSGRPEQYGQLHSLLGKLDSPVRLIPGNHDDRQAVRAVFFPDRSPEDRLCDVLELAGLRLVLLDDVVPGSPCGELGDEQLTWLDSALATDPDRPAVITLHHAPFSTGIVHMDKYGLLDAAAFADVVSRHPQVEAVLCGHLHRPITTRWAGTVAITSPSVAHQVTLDLSPDGPARFVLEPPAFMLHLWREGAGLVSHLSYVGSFDGPYKFPRSAPWI